jgi:HD-GYP domain-containing protein (c-di-GMP phosphodiesterase class II)/CHASE2 domain-containing sensor protein
MFYFIRTKNFYHPFFIWVIFLLWYIIYFQHVSPDLRDRTDDLITNHSFRIFGTTTKSAQDIVIVTIDSLSREKLNLKWPWQRDVTAKLIRNIIAANPKVIAIDIVFAGKSLPEHDQELVNVLASHPNIILGYTIKDNFFDLPSQEFSQAAGTLGFVNKLGESQNKILRNTWLFFQEKNGKINLSIDIEVLAKYLNIPRQEIQVDAKTGITLANKLFISAPAGLVAINYQLLPKQFTTIPAKLVLENQFSPEIIKDKIVLIGATDPLIHDEHLTPLGIFPGVMIIANSLLMLLKQNFLHTIPYYWTLLIAFLLGLLILIINNLAKFTLASAFTALTMLLSFIILLITRSYNLKLDYFTLFFFMISAYLIANIFRYAYLTLLGEKLRILSITDPSTGFYTYRYFLLKLDEELKNSSAEINLAVVHIDNYRKLIAELNFDETKNLIKLVSQFIKDNLTIKFPKAFFCRIAYDSLGVVFFNTPKKNIDRFFSNLVDQLRKTAFKLEDKLPLLHLSGILISKIRNINITSRDIIQHLETALKSPDKRPNDYQELIIREKNWNLKQSDSSSDMLVFLTSDLEERNKELEKVIKSLSEAQKETYEAYFQTIRSLIKALEAKDTYTQGHSERVAKYALAIGKFIGLNEEDCDALNKAALLHDIGKIGIPEYILHKKEKLTTDEIEIIRRHPLMSMDILKPIKPFKNLLPIVLSHHERFDGTGYPYGLAGEMIPRGAQILAVADSFDAITCGRGYKKGTNINDTISEMEKNKGTQFNPIYVDTLKKLLTENAADIL